MDKMRMESLDLTNENIEKIGEMFPNVITETLDTEKSTPEKKVYKKAVNFDMLRTILGDEVAGDEVYEFTWVGKKAAMVEAGKPVRKTLRPCKEESKDWDTTENLYIEGDNLDVLKLLQESYLGKVKMIYIDPPYNTGKDSFVYSDNYKMEEDEYEEQIGLYDEHENKQFRENNESNPRFHSDWCSMILARLQLARNLMSDDGIIFISIDDNEVENLKKICNEVFGESNFIAQFIWIKKKKGSHLSKTIRSMTEYVLCYAKYYNLIELYGEDAYIDKQQPLAKRTNSIKNLKFPEQLVNTTLKDGIYKANNYGEGSSSIDFSTDFVVKDKKIISELNVNGPFVWTQEKLNFEILAGSQINLSSRFGFNVLRSDQKEKIKRPSTLIDSNTKVGTNEDAYNEAIEIFNLEGIMSYPKPVSLITFIINTITYFDKNSIILDFFSGSATTAHAVMKLNAEDGGNRKFIMVQLPEETNEKSEAYKAGYKNICEIGKERIRRAGEKIKEEAGLSAQNLDIGFRVFKLDSTNMKDVYYSASKYDQAMLDDLTSNIKEDRTELDLLFGCLLEWGLPLSMPYTSEQISGVTIHTYNDGDLIACFAEKVPENVVNEIAKRQPLRAVFRDSSFASSPEKINVEEIFKLNAPNTSIKVL